MGTIRNEMTIIHDWDIRKIEKLRQDAIQTLYNIDGKILSDDGGETWYVSGDSRVNVTFPYTVPDNPEKVYINKEVE